MYGRVGLGMESVLSDVVQPISARAVIKARGVERCIFIYDGWMVAKLTYFFNTPSKNSNNAFVGGSSGRPRLSFSLLWLVSLAAKRLAGMSTPLSTDSSRCACALT